jgi:hypothetical protein
MKSKDNTWDMVKTEMIGEAGLFRIVIGSERSL